MDYANDIFFPEQLEQEFPFWRCLHGFWCVLPNFNPYTASSESRQDLAGNTLALIHGRRHDNNNGYKEEEEDFYTNDTQNSLDEGVDSEQQSIEQVCC